MGYDSNIKFSIDNKQVSTGYPVDEVPIQGYDNIGRFVIVGYYRVFKISNVTSGTHNIWASAYAMMSSRNFGDGITLNVTN